MLRTHSPYRILGSRGFILSTGTRGCDFGQAEIQNLGMSTLGHKNVGRLDVAVDDAFGVGSIQRVGNLDGQAEECLCFHGTVADEVLQCLAVQEFHGDVGAAVFIADFVNGANVGMVQCGGGLRFALESFESVMVVN